MLEKWLRIVLKHKEMILFFEDSFLLCVNNYKYFLFSGSVIWNRFPASSSPKKSAMNCSSPPPPMTKILFSTRTASATTFPRAPSTSEKTYPLMYHTTVPIKKWPTTTPLKSRRDCNDSGNTRAAHPHCPTCQPSLRAATTGTPSTGTASKNSPEGRSRRAGF